MKRRIFGTIALLIALAGSLFSQKITDTWQGSLQPPQGRALRLVIKISRADNESLKAVLYSIDQGGQALNASSASLQGSVFKMAIAGIGATYEGKLASDGNSIAGTWTQGGGPAMPLNLARATPETAWAIPEPPPPPRQMAADAKPTFEVATIKPSNPENPGQFMLVGRGGGNLFTTGNTPLKALIVFAYGLHAKQISGGPGWMETENYDISAKPDTAGVPNIVQLQSMLQKLLVDRFGLEFHREKKEMPAYVITVAKTGVKMTKTENSPGNLPGFGGGGRGSVNVRNAKMSDFAIFLQSQILDRPVVDQTGLTDRFDFTLRWTPDSAQAGPGRDGGAPPPPPDNAEAPPDLFTAVLQQLGLKLESTKAPVDVMVIDKVGKPSAN